MAPALRAYCVIVAPHSDVRESLPVASLGAFNLAQGKHTLRGARAWTETVRCPPACARARLAARRLLLEQTGRIERIYEYEDGRFRPRAARAARELRDLLRHPPAERLQPL